jgi:hypothetical protein
LPHQIHQLQTQGFGAQASPVFGGYAPWQQQPGIGTQAFTGQGGPVM